MTFLQAQAALLILQMILQATRWHPRDRPQAALPRPPAGAQAASAGESSPTATIPATRRSRSTRLLAPSGLRHRARDSGRRGPPYSDSPAAPQPSFSLGEADRPVE